MRKKPGFASYVPVYHQVDCGGRWYEQGSAFQGLPGIVKAALIQGTDQANYDLRACHVAAAVALAGEINSHAMYVGDEYLIICGLDASPEEMAEGVLGVRDLLKSKKSYDVIAEAVNLPRRVVKTCIIACLYGVSAGSWMDVDDDGRVRRSTAVMETLLEHHGGDISAARRSHKRLYPKLRNIVRFAEGLLRAMTLTMTNPQWWRRCRGRLRSMIMIGYNGNVTSAVRTTITVLTGHDTPYAERRAAARRVLSHVLTGIEQDAIGHLLQSCKDHGVVVLHLEHDGLIVRGAIPAVCVDEMRRDSLLAAYADLDVKPFPIADATDPLGRIVERVLAVTTEAENIQE